MSRVERIDDSSLSPGRGGEGGGAGPSAISDLKSEISKAKDGPHPNPLPRVRGQGNRSALFELAELRRVGVAATMMVVCGTMIIITMTMMLGHYNSLAHSGPKAVLDGAVIGLLVGRRGRWRCLTLLGVVYGLVLLLQIGVFYLLPVMAVAAGVAALAGWVVGVAHRFMALIVAAIVYELLAGCGAPMKIYFGTDGRSEPFLWGMWFAEWPFRIVGAAVGVWLAGRWKRRNEGGRPSAAAVGSAIVTTPSAAPVADGAMPLAHHPQLPRAKGIGAAALRLTASVVACVLPMLLDSAAALGLLAVAYAAYALWAGLRWRILYALLGLLWGWVIFGLFSYLWHHDLPRVLDMLRTLVLRFTPITLSSMVLVSTTRPVDVVRLLRRFRTSPAILLPLAAVIRELPASRRELRESMARLRREKIWTGPLSLIRRPVPLFRGLFGPRLRRWVDQLAE